jgi:primosomal protein N' (replication factor Y)
VIFVSAAPSAELWHEVTARSGRLAKIRDDRPLVIQPIDLANYQFKGSLVSFPLRNHIEQTLRERKKVLLFLNRRGFSTTTKCLHCGHILKCPRCSAHLSGGDAQEKMVCRHCFSAQDLPRLCPQCQKPYLKSVGIGIEKVEHDLARLFPSAKIVHFDRETAHVPAVFDILIATQAVLKLAPDLKVALTGVLDADAELGRLDFRAAQRTFSTLMALRQMTGARMIIQTRQMDNYCFQAVIKNDYAAFYAQELKLRKQFALPPYRHLIAVGVRSVTEASACEQADRIYKGLAARASAAFTVVEPQADTIAKLRDQYRFTVMAQVKDVAKSIALIKKFLSSVKRRADVIITLNVDP